MGGDDQPRRAEAISGIESVERLDDGAGFGVGTEEWEPRVVFGRTATEDMSDTEVDLRRSYVVEANSHGAEYRTTQSVSSADGGRSLLTMLFSGIAFATLAKVMSATIGKLFENATRTVYEGDLVDVAAASETANRSAESQVARRRRSFGAR